jgi:hypothetical protein
METLLASTWEFSFANLDADLTERFAPARSKTRVAGRIVRRIEEAEMLAVSCG